MTAPSTTEQPRAPRAKPARLVIGLVEDHEDIRELVGELLEVLGHQVLTADNGVDGVELVCREEPHMAIIDLGLPGLDGFSVATRVRAALGDRILLVALTGYSRPEDVRRALAAGFDVHVPKPIDAAQLRSLVDQAAARHRDR